MEKTSTTFKEMLEHCSDTVNNKITEEELFDWFNQNFSVKKYVPIETKYSVGNVVKIFTFEESLVGDSAIEYTIYEEYTNYDVVKNMMMIAEYIGCPVMASDRVASNFDSFVESGLYDYIVKMIEIDFSRFDKIVDKCSCVDFVPMQVMITEFLEKVKLEETVNGMLSNISQNLKNIDLDGLKK